MFPIRKTPLLVTALLLLWISSANAQSVAYHSYYAFEPTYFTTPPQLGGLAVKVPDSVIKNGVEGVAKVSFVLGEDGKTRDIQVTQDLPGVGDALIKAVQAFYFKPAMLDGKPVPMKMSVEYSVSLEYAEGDKDVTKAKIVEKPAPVYPAKYAAEKVKGKVEVTVRFFADGKLDVLGVSSTMERDFDKAAAAAAAKIKFEPAFHKKTKKPVTQQMVVAYEFKP